MEVQRAKVGLLLVSTNRYDVFVQPLIDSVKEHFFKNQKVTIYLFTDRFLELFGDERVSIEQFIIEPYKFPFATLYRYKTFAKHSGYIKTDYVFYSDVDMKFVAPVGEEILPDESQLTATQHPGFWKGGWGSEGTHPLSKAYVHPKNRKNYYCGGFQGGTREAYLNMSADLMHNIEADFEKAKEINFKDNNGVLADWHDETHYNWFMSTRNPKVLTPSYCFPPKWDLPFEKKLLALDKDHAAIRA